MHPLMLDLGYVGAHGSPKRDFPGSDLGEVKVQKRPMQKQA
jgi:hypothetical protein